MLPYFVFRSCSKQKLRRTASPLYHGSAFLAGGHAAQDKKAPCLPVAVLYFSLVLETKAAPNRFAALWRLSVSRIRPRGTRQKSTLFAVGRTLFLARARNKSCAEPLRRSMAAQRFSHTATRHAKKQTPPKRGLFFWCRWPDSNRHGIATGGF